jgi:hypothetical protein
MSGEEMKRALEADGKKLRQLTGEDHGPFVIEDELTVLKCWACPPPTTVSTKCRKCGGTGRVFWVDGRAYPYTSEGEKAARREPVK